jgi:hypothetical protein
MKDSYRNETDNDCTTPPAKACSPEHAREECNKDLARSDNSVCCLLTVCAMSVCLMAKPDKSVDARLSVNSR